MLSAADHLIPGAHYVRSGLNLGHFLHEPGWMLAHYLTFTYVPNYFDIIPMYIGLLAMIPLFVIVAEWSRVLAGAICVLVWLAAAVHLLELPAEPWSSRPWYFNPFSWQLLFFTGYAFGRGWLRQPKPRTWLIAASIGVVAISVPLACASCSPGLDKHVPGLSFLQAQLAVFGDKTHAGAARYIHFMALAYLASLVSGAGGRRLCGRFAEILRTTGCETLPVFLGSLVLSQALGIFLDLTGRSWEMVALANIGGCVALVLIAHMIAWFKRRPWDNRARLDASAPRGEAQSVSSRRAAA
jgi:hypothetical protein